MRIRGPGALQPETRRRARSLRIKEGPLGTQCSTQVEVFSNPRGRLKLPGLRGPGSRQGRGRDLEEVVRIIEQPN